MDDAPQSSAYGEHAGKIVAKRGKRRRIPFTPRPSQPLNSPPLEGDEWINRDVECCHARHSIEENITKINPSSLLLMEWDRIRHSRRAKLEVEDVIVGLIT